MIDGVSFDGLSQRADPAGSKRVLNVHPLPRTGLYQKSGILTRPSVSGKWPKIGGMKGECLAERARLEIRRLSLPARPVEVAPLILRAHGLTDREAGVAQLVLPGLSTEEIAHALCISTLTVQQHLKAIFEKVGVHSRRELMARIFSRYYLDSQSAPGSSERIASRPATRLDR